MNCGATWAPYVAAILGAVAAVITALGTLRPLRHTRDELDRNTALTRTIVDSYDEVIEDLRVRANGNGDEDQGDEFGGA